MEPELKPGNIDNTRGASHLLITIALEAVNALNDVQPKDHRVRILQLSMLRAVRIAGACLMLDEQGFVEEVLALSRTLAEVVITACYLQIAAEQEVVAFRKFDIQKSYTKTATLEEFLEPEERISDEHRKRLEEIVAEAEAESGRKSTKNSWTEKSVYAMALELDATMQPKTHLFVHVKATTYEFGNPYVHGTFGSFGAVRQWLAEGAFPTDEGRAVQRFQAAEGIYQCLAALCLYANERFSLPFRQRIWDARMLNEKE